MKHLISLLTLVGLLYLGACKKEDCPEVVPEVPYTSTMSGEVSNGLRYSITNAGSQIEQSCNGWFLIEVYTFQNDSIYHKGYNIQVVEGLSDSIKEWDNYHEKEFVIDFEFIGTGYECIYIDGLTEWSSLPPTYPVEQVKITKIEEAP